MHARFFRLSTLQVVVWQVGFAGKPQGRRNFPFELRVHRQVPQHMSATRQYVITQSIRRLSRKAHALALGLALIGTLASAHDASRPEVEYHPTTVAELHAIIDQVRQAAAPEQAKAVDAIETGAEADLDRLGQAAIKAHHHKVGVLLRDKPDAAAFERAQTGELRAEAALAKRIDQVLVALAKTLTPEQRAQFRAHNGE